MAALLFALEQQKFSPAERKDSSAAREKIHPFATTGTTKGKDKQAYNYYDLGRITRRTVIYDDTYDAAVKLLKDGTLVPDRLFISYDKQDGAPCCVTEGTVHLPKGREAFVGVAFNCESLRQLRCDVPNCRSRHPDCNLVGSKEEPCEHTLAMLIAANEFIHNHEYGDATDEAGSDFLAALRREKGIHTSSDEEGAAAGRQVTLEPRITREDDELRLSFRVGCDKLYVVRNLTDLVTFAENKREISYGKLTLDFSRDVIRKEDMPLYNMIKSVIEDEQYHSELLQNSYYFYKTEFTVKSDINLYGQRLDRFFEIVRDRSVPFVDKDAKAGAPSVKKTAKDSKDEGVLRFGDEVPRVTLTISKQVDRYGVFHGVLVSGQIPHFYETSQYRYFLREHTLYRMSDDDYVAGTVFDQADEKGNIRFSIGRQSLSEFYYTVLPRLRASFDIQEQDAALVEDYLPPEVKFVFYLDLPGGVPVCRAVSQYGEQERATMDSINPDIVLERFRDMHRERDAVEAIQRYFPQIDEKQGLFVSDGDEESVYNLLENGIEALSQIGEVQGSDDFRALRIRPKVHIKVGVSVESDLMNLTIGSTDVSPEELLEILASYRRKKRYHRLKSGDFVDIGEDVSELSAMMDTLHLSQKDLLKGGAKIPSYRALYLDKMSEDSDALDIRRDKAFKKIIQGFKTVSESDFEVPEGLQDIMRGYQVYGHKWLRTLEAYGFGGILADDMGLGKTLQMISVFAAAKAEGKQGTSMVICPSSLVYNWLAELNRFAPELSAVVVAGTQKERSELIDHLGNYDVAVTSYDLFKRDVELYEGKSFLYQVIDEAQYIKTHTTAAAKSVKLLQSKVRFALTGTPIENRLSELWSIFDYLMPGFLYGYETFRKEFETPITKKNDEEASRRLKRMVSPFILRRLKSDVLRDLPDKIEEVRYAKFEKEQQLVYDSQVVYMTGMVEGKDDEFVRKNKLQILAELTKIRQICCDPSLLLEDYHGGSAKRQTCLELIQSAMEGEHRVLLFSQFTSMLALLEEDLRGAGIAFFKITGSTPKKERMELVEQFNTGDTPVFLISLKAGGTGLNLTGADVVIHYDPWWNVAAQNQATDRAHRIGQTRTVSVYRLIVKDSIEEKILQLQELKKNLADEILAGSATESSLSQMTKEDLIALLS